MRTSFCAAVDALRKVESGLIYCRLAMATPLAQNISQEDVWCAMAYGRGEVERPVVTVARAG